MRINPILWALVATSCWAGCGHTQSRGSVLAKVDEHEARVSMGTSDVKPGDRVRLFKNVCPASAGAAGTDSACERVEIGEGTVERVFDERSSLVRVDPGVAFDAGTVVEADAPAAAPVREQRQRW